MSYVEQYLKDAASIIAKIDTVQIEKIIDILIELRHNHGRIFFIGVGGSAGNCSHAVNDFRKIGGFQAYTPADNVSELTARTNDEGWVTVFVEWLKTSRLDSKDAVFVLSVGGGSKEKDISANIVYALEYAKEHKAKILGIIGRDGGYTAKVADACVVVPPVNAVSITPHTESFQGVIWHLIVSDPRIMQMSNKWEKTLGK
ncbi:MAG: SIS domain-containing protein [Candidatus Omnitrophota bacterium]